MSTTTERRPKLTLKNPPPRPIEPLAKPGATFEKPKPWKKLAKDAAKPAANPAQLPKLKKPKPGQTLTKDDRRTKSGRLWTEGEKRQEREMLAAIKRRKAASREMFKKIQALAPALFDPAARKPLALRIDIPICTALGVPARKVSPSLKWWTADSDYSRAVLAGGPRYALDGSVAGMVTEAEQAHARARLKLPPVEPTA